MGILWCDGSDGGDFGLFPYVEQAFAGHDGGVTVAVWRHGLNRYLARKARWAGLGGDLRRWPRPIALGVDKRGAVVSNGGRIR